jgi:hypothetical protein
MLGSFTARPSPGAIGTASGWSFDDDQPTQIEDIPKQEEVRAWRMAFRRIVVISFIVLHQEVISWQLRTISFHNLPLTRKAMQQDSLQSRNCI